MKLCMIGTGYVGLVSGVCFSDLGNTVYCVDNDKKKIESLNNGIIPIYEPGLEEILKRNYKAKRLLFTNDLKKAVSNSDIIFICVGTPTKKNSNSADLKYVFAVANQLKKIISKYKIVITKSTVPVTTGDKIEKILSKLKNKRLVDVVSNPEFLREGEAIRDFIYPDRIVVGFNGKKSSKILKNLYSPLISKGASYLQTSRRAAELIKYASNGFLASKITFINEIANLCEKIDVNIEDISIGIGLDKRIGSRFLRAGPGYGGSCFPKDTKALLSTAKNFNTELSIVNSVIKSNNRRHKISTSNIIKILNNRWPGPTTFLLERGSDKYKELSYLNKHAVRVSALKPLVELLDFFGSEIVSTSANISGENEIKNKDDIVNFFNFEDVAIFDEKLGYLKKPTKIFDLKLKEYIRK